MSSVIMDFSWCVVAVTRPIYCLSTSSIKPPYLHFYVVSRTFMAGVASQAGDSDFSRAPGLTSGLQGSVIVHRGALLFRATVTVH